MLLTRGTSNDKPALWLSCAAGGLGFEIAEDRPLFGDRIGRSADERQPSRNSSGEQRQRGVFGVGLLLGGFYRNSNFTVRTSFGWTHVAPRKSVRGAVWKPANQSGFGNTRVRPAVTPKTGT